MATKTVKVIMRQRADTSTNWNTVNPVLLSGEFGYDTTNGKFKIGNGTKKWSELDYIPLNSDIIEIENTINNGSGKIISCTGDELIAISSPENGSIRNVTTQGTGSNKNITVGLYLYLNGWKKIFTEDDSVIMENDTIYSGNATTIFSD